MKKAAGLGLLAVLGGLLGAGVLLLVARLPVGEPIQLLPPPTASPLVVYVTGEVANPGVYSLSPGSRVADSIQAAGGFSEQANPSALNLAQVLSDGMRITVPSIPVESSDSSPVVPSRSIEGTTTLINVNTASQEELESLPEIGPHLAGEIIAYREANGPFETIEELLNVPGIGEITLDTIRELITLEPIP